MAKDTYTTHVDLGSNPVSEIHAHRERVTQFGAQTQYGVYTFVKGVSVRLGTVWKDTSQPQRKEWLSENESTKGAHYYHPTMDSALTALGKRTLPAVLEEAQEAADEPQEAADEPAVDKVKVLLAKRILRHSKKCDEVREGLKKAYTVPDLQQKTQRLSDSIAAIDELQEVWEALYGSIPSIAEVHQTANSL